MRTLRASCAISLLLLAAACARSPAPDSTPPSRAIEVQVDNQNFNDMNVYLMNNGTRWLVGSVGAMTKATLTVPPGVAPADHRLRLRAEPAGGGSAITTPELVVPAGEQVYWTIGTDQAASTASTG
jgi:hypothetical protein